MPQGGTAAYSEFFYGPNRERIRQVAQKDAGTTETTVYVGRGYERLTRVQGGTSVTEHVHYIRGGGETVAVVKRDAGAGDVQFRSDVR